MNPQRLKRLLEDATKLKVGDSFPGWESESDIQEINCHFVTIGVLKPKLGSIRREFWPIIDEFFGRDYFASNPGYSEVAEKVKAIYPETNESELLTFRIFSLGEVLGVWHVVTPKDFHLQGPAAEDAARAGCLRVKSL